jgi:hypothetical protein
MKPPSMIPGYPKLPAHQARKPDQIGGGGGGGGSSSGGSMHPMSGAHTASIHKAAGMNLAQLSAAGTNPAIPPPKIGGPK